MADSMNVKDFLHSRLSHEGLFIETNENFPTVEAARFGLEALALTKHQLGNVAEATYSLLNECRFGSGGFSMSRQNPEPELSATYYASRLHHAGLVPGPLLAREQLKAWVRRQIFIGQHVRPDMDVDELYYAVRALQAICFPDAIPYSECRTIAAFLDSCAAPMGGFGLKPREPADINVLTVASICCNFSDYHQELRLMRHGLLIASLKERFFGLQMAAVAIQQPSIGVFAWQLWFRHPSTGVTRDVRSMDFVNLMAAMALVVIRASGTPIVV